jgi:hypothetical protein
VASQIRTIALNDMDCSSQATMCLLSYVVRGVQDVDCRARVSRRGRTDDVDNQQA